MVVAPGETLPEMFSLSLPSPSAASTAPIPTGARHLANEGVMLLQPKLISHPHPAAMVAPGSETSKQPTPQLETATLFASPVSALYCTCNPPPASCHMLADEASAELVVASSARIAPCDPL